MNLDKGQIDIQIGSNDDTVPQTGQQTKVEPDLCYRMIEVTLEDGRPMVTTKHPLGSLNGRLLCKLGRNASGWGLKPTDRIWVDVVWNEEFRSLDFRLADGQAVPYQDFFLKMNGGSQMEALLVLSERCPPGDDEPWDRGADVVSPDELARAVITQE